MEIPDQFPARPFFGTIKGRVFVSKSPKPPPGIIQCSANIRSRYKYNPETDLWKINVVNGLVPGTVHGTWIIKSNYNYKSEVNITKLWHRFKGMIESKELPVVKMECPSTPNGKTPPEIHITTTEAHATAVGKSIQDIVKYVIEYFPARSGEKMTLLSLSLSEEKSKLGIRYLTCSEQVRCQRLTVG